eukprot:jgi/Phyca11/502738/fgenesh2_kg.PHYCAscaffold_1_\
MSETPRRRERVNVVWKPAHLTGVLVLALAFLDASTVVRVVRILLFLYFVLSSLDLALTRYYLRKFESTTPELKRYALVTGASSGLGREMSYMLSEQKYSLVLAARTETVLERMRAEIELGINKLIQFVKDKELVIDILVNNAGACLTKDFTLLKEKEIDELMTLDMHAMVKLTHAIVQQMVERKIGRVLNISSVAGTFAVPTAALYGVALSYELRSTGVTVTGVCPGPVDTNFSKTADLDKAVCTTVPGLAADA